MSKFWIYLKTNLRADLKQAHIVAGIFLFLPLFFSLLTGFSYSSAFVPDATIDPIQVSVQNDDRGEVGELFLGMITSEEMEEYIQVVEEADADFHLSIHPNYSASIQDTEMTIETKENSSSAEETMLKQLIVGWQQAAVDQEQIKVELASIENPQVLSNLQNSLQQLTEMELDSIFIAATYHSETALTSNQFTSVTGIMFALFLTLSGGVGMSTSKELKGVRKRLGVVPFTPREAVLFEIGANTITYVLLITLYIIIWRIIDLNTFIGNPLVYLFWILIYTLFFQALNSALLYLVPDKLSNVFFQIVFMFYMVFGFLPLDRMMGGEFGEFFSQNFVRKLFNQPLYDYMLTQDFTQNLGIAIGLLTATFVIIGLTITYKNRRELQTA